MYGFKVFLMRRGLMDRGMEYYMWHVEKFFEYSGCELSDFGDLRKFKKKYDAIIMRDISNEGKKKYLKCIRIFSDFLLEEELISENVARKVQPPRVQTSLPIPVEDEEINNIFLAIERRWSGALAYRNKVIVETFLFTGLRRAELINLRREDVCDDFIVVRCGKWGKDRVVYIPRSFSEGLSEYMKQTGGASEYVFFSLRREKISVRAMSRIFEEIKKEAWLKRLHCHKMRHTYTSEVLESGISLAVLRDQLGHASIATTNRYIAVRNSHRKESIQKLEIRTS